MFFYVLQVGELPLIAQNIPKETKPDAVRVQSKATDEGKKIAKATPDSSTVLPSPAPSSTASAPAHDSKKEETRLPCAADDVKADHVKADDVKADRMEDEKPLPGSVCYGCGSKDHLSTACPSRKDVPSGACFNCNSVDHQVRK
jgi:hypothetical protein